MRLNAATANAKRVARLTTAVALQFLEHAGVLRGVGQHRDVVPVLRRRAHHRRAADVDVLDRVLERAAGLRDRRLERVEVDDEQVDRRDAVRRSAPPCARAGRAARAGRRGSSGAASSRGRRAFRESPCARPLRSPQARPPASSCAVPPVESSLQPSACSARASSTTPVLSETEMRACMASFASWANGSMGPASRGEPVRGRGRWGAFARRPAYLISR